MTPSARRLPLLASLAVSGLSGCASPCLFVSGSCLDLRVEGEGELRAALVKLLDGSGVTLESSSDVRDPLPLPRSLRYVPQAEIPLDRVAAVRVEGLSAQDGTALSGEATLRWPAGDHVEARVELMGAVAPRDGGADLLPVLDMAQGGPPATMLFERIDSMGLGLQPAVLAVGDWLERPQRDLAISGTQTGPVGFFSLDNGGRYQFQAGLPLAGYMQPISALLSGDWDRDGKDDVILVSRQAGAVYWGRRTGAGTFQVPGQPLFSETGAAPGAAVLADIDGDARLDLIIADGGAGKVVVRRSSDSSLQTLLGFGSQPVALRPGDQNGDRRTDVALAERGSGEVMWLLNQAGQLVRGTRATCADAVDLAVLDLDGDGRSDLLAACAGDPALLLVLANGTRSMVPLPLVPLAIAAGDLGSDGRPGVAVLASSGTLIGMLADGRGGLLPPEPTRELGGPARSIACEDVDRDGRGDLLIGTGDRVVLLRNLRP